MTKKLLAALLVCFVGTGLAHAAVGPPVNSWNGPNGNDWDTTSWSLGLPVAGANVSVRNNLTTGNLTQTLTYSNPGSPDFNTLVIDGSAHGAMSLVVTGLLSVNSGGAPVTTLGGSTINGSTTVVGDAGAAALTLGIGGGLNTGTLILGSQLGSTGTVNILAGAVGINVVAPATLIIGDAGAGVFNQASGTTNDINLIVGNQPTGNGTINLTGGTININFNGDPGGTGNAIIGNSGTGLVNHSNADNNAVVNIGVGAPAFDSDHPGNPFGGYMVIGRNDGSSGRYVMTDTLNGNVLILNVGHAIQIGGSNIDPAGFTCNATCTGSFEQNGGLVQIGSPGFFGALTIGIGNGTGSYTINGGTLNADGLDVGNSSSQDNRFTHNGGTVNAGGMFVGNGTGSNGTYTLNNDGVLNSGSFAQIGVFGTGTFTQNDNSVHNAGDVSIGFSASGNGTYNLNGGTFNVGTATTGSLLVGDMGQGTFNMTGGTLNIFNNDVGTAAFVVGDKSGSIGIFTQSGGDVNGGRALAIGLHGGTGTYNLNTDTVNGTTPTLTTGFIALGNNSGQGTFNQQTGTLNTTGSLFIGQQGTYNLNGGSLVVNPGGQGTIVGTSGVGAQFNQTGGTHTTDRLILGNNSAASGTYVLSGGDLVVNGQMFVGRGDNNLNPNLLNGLFQQSDGNVTAAQIFIGGFTDGPNGFSGTGRYELSGGTVNSQFTSVGWLAQGRVLQTGGTFNNTGELQLGSAGLFSVPDGNGGFTFYSSGTYDLQGGVLNTGSTTVGVFGQGTFNQSGTSQHVVTNNLIVGSQPGLIEPVSGVARQGIYTLSESGLLIVGGDAIIGGGNLGAFNNEPGAKGTFTQSGGNFIVTGGVNPGDGNLIIGQGSTTGGAIVPSAGATGSYNLSGGSLSVFTATIVGGDAAPGLGGTGVFTQTGGTHTTTFLSIGGANATGTYDLSGTGVVNSGITYIGAGVGSNGTVTQHGGTQNTAFLNIGLLGGATGTYNMSGGQANISDSMNVGGGTAGTVNQSGGNVAVTFILTVNEGGTYNLINGSLSSFRTVVGANDVGAVFNQSGGTHTIGTNPVAPNFDDQVLTIGLNTDSGGTYNMSGGVLTVLGNLATNNSSITVGAAGTGLFVQTGGTVTANGTNSLAIGDCCGGSGEYRISAGNLNSTGNTFVGAHELGTMTQTGGAVSLGADVLVGYDTGAVGHYNQSGGSVLVGNNLSIGTFNGTGTYSLTGTGTLQVGGNEFVGENGVATFTQGSGTTNTVNGDLNVGRFNTVTGSTYTLNGGALNTGRTIIAENGIGTFTQNGGTHNITANAPNFFGDMLIGFSTGSNGVYNLNNGALNIATNAFVGAAGMGTFNQSGGTATAAALVLGNNTGGNGHYTLSNGSFTVTGAGGSIVGAAGTGVFDQTGGTHNTTNIVVGNNAGGSGTYNLSGAGSQLLVSGSTLVGGAGTGTFNQTGGTQTVTGNVRIANHAGTTGTFNLSGGTLTAANVTINSGGVAAGTFNYSGGALSLGGGTGTVINNAGGMVNLSGAGTRVVNGNLTNSGTVNLTTAAQVNGLSQTGGTINLAANNLSVTKDYTNANFGTGNNFDARADVTGSGQIIGVNASQTITGDATAAIPPNTFTLNFGSMRGGGTSTLNYQIANNGTGADIRGAIQTGGPGLGNITDARLSGSGVPVGGANFGPLTAGSNTGNLAVTFAATAGGGSLAGQSIAVVSNFGNVATQFINLAGNADTQAVGNATPNNPPVVNLGNFHVGGTQPTQNFAVQNTAAGTLATTERLGIATATTTGNFSATNNLGAGFINPGASLANAVTAAVSGGAAGANNGSVRIQYTTNGVLIDPTYTTINANLQTINVAATGYNLAAANVSPNPVTVANQRINGTITAALTVANSAPVDATFTETLSASFANANTGNATNNGGTVSGIAGGGSNNTLLKVGVDTTAAGARTGTVTVNLTSNEVNASGLGNTPLGPQIITVNGNVYQAAIGQLNPPTSLNFGTVQVGQTVTQTLSITNAATGPAGFVEDLSASFGASTGTGANRISGTGTIGTLLAGATNNSNLVVHVDTSAAANINGNIAVNYFTNGAVNGVSNGLGVAARGSDPFGVVGTIAGQIVDQASPVINGIANPGSVNVILANARINTAANQTLTVLNQSTPNQQAALNASISSNGAPITASGSFNQLLPGNSSPGQAGIGTLQVGMDTTAAGHKSGSATVALVSDATNIGNCGQNGCQMNLPSQTINVSGDVYRLANPLVNTASPITLAARVGDTSPQASISITNSSPDQFREGLDVVRGTTAAGFTSMGSITNLAAQQTSTAIQVSLNTTAAGHVGGTQVLLFASNGTITNNSNVGLSDGGIALSGNVYQVAAGAIQTAALNFGTVQVNQSVTQNLVIRNTASGPIGFVEDLNSAFGTSTDARIIGTGSLNGILAGTNSTAGNGTMTVSINTGAAGTVNGSIRVNHTTAGAVNGISNGLGTLGVGGEDYAAMGTIVQGNVVDQAKPVINGIANPGSVNVILANARINTAANQTLTVLNQATLNQQAALNASISSNGTPITASGSFNQLLPGNSSPGQAGIGTLQVGMDTTAAGHKSGSATVALVSDATNIGNCGQNGCQMNLPSQIINVSGDVYRLANPLVNTASPINLAGRVGGVGDTTHLTSAISISNSSPDAFTEGLNVTRGSTPAGFSSLGSVTNLAAQATSTAIQVSLNTAAAGHVGGTQVLQFASNGTITGNSDAPLLDGGIVLSGNVYTPAVAQVTSTTPINLGIVHVGDPAPSTHVSVKNNAPIAGPNDTLLMSFASATGPFAGSGNLGLIGLGAQATDSTSLNVGMNTTTAGVYSGHATFHAASHDSELADFNLADVDVDLQGQVNNFALAAFRKNNGSGAFSGGGTSYLLDFGQLVQNTGDRFANLGVFNNVLGPADVLSGSFCLPGTPCSSDPTLDFGETGFGPFSGLLAGVSDDLLNLDFSTLVLGTFQDQIRLTWHGSNAGGFQGQDQFILLTLRANVVQQGNVPEPGTLWLMLLCLTALAYSASRRTRPLSR